MSLCCYLTFCRLVFITPLPTFSAGFRFSFSQPQHFIPISFYRIICFFFFPFLAISFLPFIARIVPCDLYAASRNALAFSSPTAKSTVSARSGIRKYVVWCLICGGLSCLLGIMFLGVYFLVRSYTSTIGYFETVPTFVPATLVSNFRTHKKSSHSIFNYFWKIIFERVNAWEWLLWFALWVCVKMHREWKKQSFRWIETCPFFDDALRRIFSDRPFAHTQAMWAVISRVNSYGTSNLLASQAKPSQYTTKLLFYFMVISAFVLWTSHWKWVVWKCHPHHKIIIFHYFIHKMHRN